MFMGFHASHSNQSAVGSVESDDSAALLEELAEAELHLKTARDIMENYREFCKRVRVQLPH